MALSDFDFANKDGIHEASELLTYYPISRYATHDTQQNDAQANSVHLQTKLFSS